MLQVGATRIKEEEEEEECHGGYLPKQVGFYRTFPFLVGCVKFYVVVSL
jgi:hypothetical protein